MLGDKERSQVDMYDVFGYLVPGFIVFLSIILSIGYLHGLNPIAIFDYVKHIQLGQFVALSILSLIISYLFGHIIATISEVIFDRIFVAKIFGYPFANMVFGKDRKARKYSVSKNYYRVQVSLIYSISTILILYPSIDFQYIDKVIDFMLVLLFLIIPIKWIESWGEIKGEKNFPKWSRLPLRGSMFIFKAFLLFLSIPFQGVETILRNMLHLDSKLPKDVIDELKKEFKDVIGIDVSQDLDTDIYWLIYWYVAEKSTHLRDRLYKFLSLYGLTRNASVALYLSAIVVAVPGYYESGDSHAFILSIALLLSSIVMSIRYYYLYYNYYSKSLFRSFLVLRKIESQSRNVKKQSG